MSFAAALLVLLLSAARAAAQTPPSSDASGEGDGRPAVVDPKTLQKSADDLRDSVADQHVSEYNLHARAAALFTNVQSQTPLVRPDWQPVDRERVDGSIGTVDGMVETANQRFDSYRAKFHEPPPPEVLASAAHAQSLRDQKRAAFDKTGKMPENQMGVFRYNVEQLNGGIVEINRRMALLATRIGEAFAYSTLVHEATHARDREAGRLDPEHEIEGEMHAFFVQYLWLTTMDPTGMRLVVLHSTLQLWLQKHPDDSTTALSIKYLEHLLALWDTHGETDKLRAFVEKLGYQEEHEGPPPPSRPAPAAATPVRA